MSYFFISCDSKAERPVWLKLTFYVVSFC